MYLYLCIYAVTMGRIFIARVNKINKLHTNVLSIQLSITVTLDSAYECSNRLSNNDIQKEVWFGLCKLTTISS